MGWFDGKDEINVKEIEHVRGSRILTDRPRKAKNSAPRWYDLTDPATHDLPPKPENYVEVQNQTLSRELVLEDIELPDETATKHLVVSGGTGAGKTQAIHRVLDRVLWGAAHGEKAIITDSGGQFWESRSGKADLVLNPFDGRSVLWNPFAEIEDVWDYDSLAEALVPERKTQAGNSEEEWRRYARGMISSIMQALNREGDPDPRKVADILKNPDPEALRPYLSGTAEEALLAPGLDRFLGSVVTVASLAIRPWAVLDPSGDFSIRKWVRSGGGSLFITYKDSQRALLKDLIAAWLGIAIREVLDLPPDFNRRVWLVCDELDSLGTVAGIADANTRGRKYGLCSVGAIQSKAQLDATYGPHGAQTLLSTFSSKIAFRQGSWSDAEYWSNEFGQREITEQSITKASTSGGQSASSTETVAQARKVIQTILPSQLGELADRVAYCRFPGTMGIHQIEFAIRKYKPIRPAFLPPGELEPEFEDPKVEVVKKVEPQEEPFRIPFAQIAGAAVLGLVGWFLISPPEWLTNPKKETMVPPDVAAPDQGPKYKVFHWTHGTFRCRVDHSTGDRPWACVRIGPAVRRKPLSPVSSLPVAKVDPVMRLPEYVGPRFLAEKMGCDYNPGKWIATYRPVVDVQGRFVRYTDERVRIFCGRGEK
ncbi:type IV secretion system DNA-binding domain-containing protein [Leptospirillum ferriphilum]|uniref:type IV secretion system DNA-binding domain-containing protein n=1 Tax=Leptospirillum ferriphilum TaxID=178606 RepID=UPI0009CD8E28|nr:type IV secretion system DNA-binding domain-containing protein [Leptospirillum ferriphilum]OOH82467.1 hypothetical protein BOX30_03165 [Leptospirillum ferriphilum]